MYPKESKPLKDLNMEIGSEWRSLSDKGMVQSKAVVIHWAVVIGPYMTALDWSCLS